MPVFSFKLTESQKKFLELHKDLTGRSMADTMREALIQFIANIGVPMVRLDEVLLKLEGIVARAPQQIQTSLMQYKQESVTTTINYQTSGEFAAPPSGESTRVQEMKTDRLFLKMKDLAEKAIEPPPEVIELKSD